jgi:hypothetical protein
MPMDPFLSLPAETMEGKFGEIGGFLGILVLSAFFQCPTTLPESCDPVMFR